MITIVSGLPRSGTSLLMKMLEAGGLPALTDETREADEDNPKGYYEFERVKKLKEGSSWLDQAEGKALKVISMLLYDLPTDREYKVIFMERKMEEILASQAAMLARRGESGGGPSDEEMTRHYEKHLEKLARWLEEQRHLHVMRCSYNEMVADPRAGAEKVAEFLGLDLDVDGMVKAVEPSLYRQRK